MSIYSGGHEPEKTYCHFFDDTIMTTNEIEGNELFAHVGPNIKRKRLYSRSVKAL